MIRRPDGTPPPGSQDRDPREEQTLRAIPALDPDEARDDDEGLLDRELVHQLARISGDTLEEVKAPPESARPARMLPDPADRWEELAGELRREAAASSSARRAATLLHELGRIYEVQLDQPDQALEAYRQSYDRFPGLAVNARALLRLLAQRGEWAACIPVSEAELSTASAADEKVAILVERAEIRSRQLGDLEGARDDLLRAQKIDPADPVVHEELADILRRLGEAAELEALLQRRARASENPALRSAILCQVARLREDQFQDTESAETLYRTALNTSPTNLHALQALLRTARTNRDYPAVAKLCEALAEVEEGPAAGAALWEAARTYRDRLRNPALAIATLEIACSRASEDRALLLDLADLHEREKRWTELATALDRAASLAGDRAESSVLAYRLGQVRLVRLHDVDGAIVALRQAVTLAPDNVPARHLLGRLYARRERWDELVGLLSDELDLFTDVQRRATTAYRIGELFETKLNDLDRAIESYEQALGFSPGFRPALRAISRVFGRLERYEDLVAVYEKQLAHTDRDERIHILRRISELWERKLGDPAAALSSYERLVAIEPSNPQAMRALHRLYAIGSRWQDLVGVLKSDADQTMDRWRRVALLVEAAEVQERRMGAADAALQTYLDLLDDAPTYQPALMAAGRLLAKAGRFEDLLRLHQRELEHTEDPQHRVWLLMKAGRLLAEKLERPEEAIRAYDEALSASLQLGDGESPAGQAGAAADQLLRIYRRLGKQAELLALYQKLPVPTSGRARALHHRRVAEILQHGARPALAVEQLRRAVGASDDDAAFYALAKLYGSIGDRQSLIQLHAQELDACRDDKAAQVIIYHKLARLWSLADHDLERAVEALERILELDPRDRAALHLLEIQLGRLEQWDKLASTLELIRYPAEDADYRTACALAISAVREDRLDDLQGAAHACVEVLERHATHPEALDTLERHYRHAANLDGMVQVLGRRLMLAQSGAEHAALLCAAASCHARRGDPKQTAELFRLAVEAHPGLAAARGWRRAALAADDGAALATALEREADASHDLARRTECRYEAGQAWHLRAGNQSRAITAYRRALDEDPRHRGATEALTALFTARKEWAELCTHLEHVAEHARDAAHRRDTLARVADLQRSRLGDVAGARRTVERALVRFPEDVGLLTTLGELCRADSDYAALAQVNHKLVSLSTDPIVLKALHFELGVIWEEKMGASSKAIAEYRKVLEHDPGDLGALTRLSALLTREEDWTAAARATELLIQRDDDRTRLRNWHLRLALIYADGFKDIKAALDPGRRALALDPGDLEATEHVAELLSRARDLRALNAHLASTLTVHRGRLERDPFRMESYQGLLRVFGWQRSQDRQLVVRILLDAIGAATEKDRAAIEAHAGMIPIAPSRTLTDEELESVLFHPDERGLLHQFLVTAEPVLRKTLALPSAPRGEKLSHRAHPRLAALLTRFAKALGGPALTPIQIPGAGGPVELDAEGSTLVVGPGVLDDPERPAVAFAIARLAARARLRHALYAQLPPDELGRAAAAIMSTVCRSFNSPYIEEALDALRPKLEKALGKRVRRQLESLALELGDRPLDPVRWRAALEQSEDRVALVLTGDVRAAIRFVILAEGLEKQATLAAAPCARLRQLLTFIVSEEHLTLRERIGMALPDGAG
jgi:tetratricopeptide (TPR) repeat protein